MVTGGRQAATSIVVGGYAALTYTTSRLPVWIDSMGLAPAGPARYVYLRFSADDYLTLTPEFLTDRTHDERDTDPGRKPARDGPTRRTESLW